MRCPHSLAPPPAPHGHCPGSLAAPPAAVRMLAALLPYIRSVIRRCGVAARNVPDVAHDVLILLLPWAACLAPEELRAPYDRCRRYARSAAARCAWNHRHREARRGERLGWEPDEAEQGQETSTPAPSPEDLLLEHEAAALRTAELDLDQLRRATTPACWRAFHAHHIEGLAVAAISAAEQAPVATIYNRLRLARLALRAAILRRRAASRTK